MGMGLESDIAQVMVSGRSCFLHSPCGKHVSIWHSGSERGKKGSKILGIRLGKVAGSWQGKS